LVFLIDTAIAMGIAIVIPPFKTSEAHAQAKGAHLPWQRRWSGALASTRLESRFKLPYHPILKITHQRPS